MVAQFPTDADGHTCLGNVYLLQDRLPEAITSYERALRYDRTHAVALRNLGFAELRNGDATMAIQYLQRSARIDPTNALVWFDLGMANFSAGKPFEACASFRRGLRLDSSSEARLTYTEVLDQQAGRLLERAIDAYASNDFSTAEAILTAVIKAYPDYAPAHAYLGHVYNHQKPSRQIEAEQAYRAALAARNYTLLEPDVAAAVLDNLGMLRLDAGDFEDAETLFRQATLLDTRYPVAFFNYGLMMARRGLYDAAAVAFADAARRDPALLEYVGHHPALDAFRTSPAYSNLMHSIEWQSN
jgi:tetratricopeptide (TPR) repeat protein